MTEAQQATEDLLENVPQPAQPEERKIPNLLRPHEVEERQEELRRLEHILNGPAHVKANVDIPSVRKQVADIGRSLERGTPRAYKGRELDRARKREEELRGEITASMPTQEMMRRNSPGAVDAHMTYERTMKRKIQEWKFLRLRLHASGEYGQSTGRDVANLEQYRPRHPGGTRDLDAAGTQIPGKSFYFPDSMKAGNVMSDDDKARLRQETAAMLAAQAAEGDTNARRALGALLGQEEAAKAVASRQGR